MIEYMKCDDSRTLQGGLVELRTHGRFRYTFFKLAQTSDHQPIRLTCERGRQNRVAFRVAREFLRERNQLTAAKGRAAILFEHPKIIPRSGVIYNLSGAGSSV